MLLNFLKIEDSWTLALRIVARTIQAQQPEFQTLAIKVPAPKFKLFWITNRQKISGNSHIKEINVLKNRIRAYLEKYDAN